MKVKEFTKKEKCSAELSVDIEPQELEAAANKVYVRNRMKFNIPGFRKGKAPRKILERMYGADIFFDDAVSDLANDAYSLCLQEYKLTTTGRPTLSDYTINDDKSATLVFVTDLYPEITLSGDYKGIEAPKAMSVDVTDDEVNNEIERARSQNVRIETVEREAKIGDVLNISFKGFTDGVPFAGGSSDSEDLELGSGAFVNGFEDQLVGHRAGDNVDVNVTFPEDYDEKLAGKDAVFKVTVHEVKEKILPEPDDDFAMDVSEFDTFEEYKNSVRENLLNAKSNKNESDFRNAVMKKLAGMVEGEIPESMIETQLDDMVERFQSGMEAQGISRASAEESGFFSTASLKRQFRADAELQVKRDLAIEKIAELENIEVPDEDIDSEYGEYAKLYKMDIEDVKKSISRDTIITSLKLRAAEKLVFDSAVPTEPEPEPERESGDEGTADESAEPSADDAAAAE